MVDRLCLGLPRRILRLLLVRRPRRMWLVFWKVELAVVARA